MDPRKKLIREYKETARPMGVYRVFNKVNGKTLLGTSRDLPSRLNRHRAQLGFGGHPNRQLQSDWNASGSDAFVFEVLDTLSPNDEQNYDPTDDLRTLEELWAEKLESAGESRY
jgi:hypothetical protein